MYRVVEVQTETYGKNYRGRTKHIFGILFLYKKTIYPYRLFRQSSKGPVFAKSWQAMTFRK